MKLTIVILLVSLLQVSTKVYSQGTKFNLNVKNKRIVEVLKEIEESSKFRFFYIREQVNVERVVSIKANQATIDDILEELFKRQGINFQVMEDFLILLSPEDITYINTNNLQQQKSISGTITDEFNQTLPGVTIYIKGTS
ncbi:MAG: SusC/RagA family TonB-linked outer membrane protein, partial [Prolixibacteraceae bacterium]|nr:SusC/RagA family TonB-linked outer membrane protein [Prolixibacteraceae bacterium]